MAPAGNGIAVSVDVYRRLRPREMSADGTDDEVAVKDAEERRGARWRDSAMEAGETGVTKPRQGKVAVRRRRGD